MISQYVLPLFHPHCYPQFSAELEYALNTIPLAKLGVGLLDSDPINATSLGARFAMIEAASTSDRLHLGCWLALLPLVD